MHTLALLLTTCLLSSPGNRLVSREMGIAMDLPDHATILQRPGEVGESVFLIREGRTTPQMERQNRVVVQYARGFEDLPG